MLAFVTFRGVRSKMSNLAFMYKMLGQLEKAGELSFSRAVAKAEPLYRRVLASHENNLGPSHNASRRQGVRLLKSFRSPQPAWPTWRAC